MKYEISCSMAGCQKLISVDEKFFKEKYRPAGFLCPECSNKMIAGITEIQKKRLGAMLKAFADSLKENPND